MNKTFLVTAASAAIIVAIGGSIAVARQSSEAPSYAGKHDPNREFNGAVEKAAEGARNGDSRKAEADGERKRENEGLAEPGPISARGDIGGRDAYAKPTIRDGRIGVEVGIATDSKPKASNPDPGPSPKKAVSRNRHNSDHDFGDGPTTADGHGPRDPTNTGDGAPDRSNYT